MVCFIYRVNSEYRMTRKTLKIRAEIEEDKLLSRPWWIPGTIK